MGERHRMGRGQRVAPAALFLLAPGLQSLSAADIAVTYLEGQAQIQKGSGWGDLAIGDKVPQEAVLRLGDASYLELSAGGSTISLNQAGTYSLRDLLSLASKVHSGGTLKAITGSLSRLLNGPAQVQTAVMGARGAKQGEQTEWVESDADVFRIEGLDALDRGDYANAIAQFHQAVAAADPDELPQITYDLAYAYSVSGDTRDSIKTLADVRPTGGESWAGDYALLKAKLMVDTYAFGQEVTWLTGGGASLAQDAERAQLYYFLLAVGYQGLTDMASEKKTLAKAISIAPDTDIGKAAAQMAAGL